ncbi:MAG: hypothetical protein AB1510_00785 [Bacillota bacterium]
MSKLRYLADIRISPLTFDSLRKAGYEVTRVSDILPFEPLLIPGLYLLMLLPLLDPWRKKHTVFRYLPRKITNFL